MSADFYCDEVLSGRTPVRVVRQTEDVIAFWHTRPMWPVHGGTEPVMGVEIERKFLIGDLPELVGSGDQIRQGYLPLAETGAVVRVRKRGTRRYLTVKSGRGLERNEYEEPITVQMFDALWPLTEGRRITKVRHQIEVTGATVEVDVFSGHLNGLMLAEVEFTDLESARRFVPPPWVGKEVTDDPAYTNRALSTSGNVSRLPVD